MKKHIIMLSIAVVLWIAGMLTPELAGALFSLLGGALAVVDLRMLIREDQEREL